MFESPFTGEETEVYTLVLPQLVGGDWDQSLPFPSLLGAPGSRLSPPGRELWRDSGVASLVICHSVGGGPVATGLAGWRWGVGVAGGSGPDPTALEPGVLLCDPCHPCFTEEGTEDRVWEWLAQSHTVSW